MSQSATDWDAISAELHEAVGHVARNAAHYEFTVYQLYSRLVGSPLAEIVALGEGYQWLYDRCKNLLQYRSDLSDEAAGRIWGMLGSGHQSMGLRNHVVHGLWMESAPGGPEHKHLAISNKRNYKIVEAKFSPLELHGIAANLEAIANELHEFVLDVFPGQFLDWGDEARSPGVLRQPRVLAKSEAGPM